MNERILELAHQARAESSQWLGSKPATTITYDELEKFAELIVRECGIVADQYNFEKNQGTINPLKTTAYEFIKEHFGVRE